MFFSSSVISLSHMILEGRKKNRIINRVDKKNIIEIHKIKVLIFITYHVNVHSTLRSKKIDSTNWGK